MSEVREIAAVSGATGFIGSAVVRELLSQGRRVRALVEPRARADNLDDLEVERVTVDVCDHDGMTQALRGCRAYYHLAAVYQVWLPDPSPIYRVNVEGTTASLLAAAKAGVERVIYTSSIAAVGLREDGIPADETVEFNLYDIANDYILTKHLSERIALRFAESGLPVVVVNPAFPFGEGDLGPTPTGKIIISVLRGDVPGVAPGGFCAVDVRDVAKAHVAAETKGRVGQRYILGNHNVTFGELLDLICRVAGLAPIRIPLPGPLVQGISLGLELWANHISKQEPRTTMKSTRYLQRQPFFDCSLARNELGMPCTPLEETVRRAIEYFRSHDMV